MKNVFTMRLITFLAACVFCVSAHGTEDEIIQPDETSIEISVDEAVEQNDGPQPPVRFDSIALQQLTPVRSSKLYGIQNIQYLEFTVRRDQVVTDAALHLVTTPSPALLPKLSHLRVYLNDELMGVVPVVGTTSGAELRQTVPLDPRMVGTFNRISLEFVGHYTDICEDLAHSSLWLDISRQTYVEINQQTLPLVNDLSYFPEPFFDTGDMGTQSLPFVFSQSPDEGQLQAAAILASYFGTKAQWRNLRFPVNYEGLPEGHAVVFATNADRPEFLSEYPMVNGPTIDLISAPDNPYAKLLLVLGRDSDDLIRASTALAVGTPLLRGQSVAITDVAEPVARQPYDAPNWIPTDRPVQFAELIDYPGQLDVSGLRPAPITLNLNLPPDLFVWRNSGIPAQIRYRYTPLKTKDDSRLTLSLNDQYVDSYLLEAGSAEGAVTKMRLPVIGNERSGTSRSLHIPAMKIGAQNSMQFDFSFATTVGAAQRDECRTVLPVDVRAGVDETSLIDFTGFDHYLEMPNLRAFARSGFPFSRMADLSETVVVIPAHPTTAQTSTFLETIATIGAQVGYPALKVRVSHDWDSTKRLDVDILLIGEAPTTLQQRPDANLLLDGMVSTLRQPRNIRNSDTRASHQSLTSENAARDATTQVQMRSVAPIGAIVGMQSEFHPQRSIVGLLASSDEGFSLLGDALGDSGKRDFMSGSVVLVRESGVASSSVGNTYFVGDLPWWSLVWYQLSDKPLVLAAVAVFAVLLAAILLWSAFRYLARRRLEHDA